MEPAYAVALTLTTVILSTFMFSGSDAAVVVFSTKFKEGGIVGQLNVAPDQNRIALTEFGDTARPIWTFTGTTQEQTNIQNQIRQLQRRDQSTNITG